MNYHILYSSTYAADILARHPSGVVHSVYRKTINLSFGSWLLAVQVVDSPLSPISLITDMTQDIIEALPVHTGQTVRFQEHAIIFHVDGEQEDEPALYFSDTYIQNLKLVSALSYTQTSQLKNHILTSICRADTKGFDMVFAYHDAVDDNPMFTVARMRLDKVSDLISISDWGHAADELVRLIGLGIGLTPSGDDFLTGVLAGFTLCHMEAHPFALKVHDRIRSHLMDTNDISGAFLTCALNGHFSQAVNSLTDLPDADTILNSFLKIGHSSGIDSLCGIYYILLNFS